MTELVHTCLTVLPPLCHFDVLPVIIIWGTKSQTPPSCFRFRLDECAEQASVYRSGVSVKCVHFEDRMEGRDQTNETIDYYTHCSEFKVTNLSKKLVIHLVILVVIHALYL